MSGSSEEPWSDNPNAPLIPYELYFVEKAALSGILLATISYGIVIILFFQCMGALLNPTDRTRGNTKWGLVAHTAATFSVLTLGNAMSLDLNSTSYIDNRGFPGSRIYPPGPYGYQWLTYYKVNTVIPNIMFFLNTCLTDGFLLYRCYVIYSMNWLVMVLPCLMYLASLALSIVMAYDQASGAENVAREIEVSRLEPPYFSICLSLNILLTLMIAGRLIQHSKNIRNAIGPSTHGGLYKTVVTMLVESCVLYAVGSLLFIGPLSARSSVQVIFAPSFGNIQVIAPFLVILRVANRTALTSDVITSKKIGSIRFKSRGESAGDAGTFLDEDPVGSMGTNEELGGAVADNIIEEVPL